MRLSKPKQPRKEENLIPLINIVFLILIFFLIASTIAPFSNRQIKLVEAALPSNSPGSPRLLIIRSDGARFIGGLSLTDDDLNAQLTKWSKDAEMPITIVADRKTNATELIATAALVKAAGIKTVKLLTRRVR